MALALFDLDNTLLAGDSDHQWGQFLVDRKLVDAEDFKSANDLFYQQYQQGSLDIDAYLRFCLSVLTTRSKDEWLELRDVFVESCIQPMIASGTEDLLNSHRQAGDTLVIITATNSFVTDPIAKLLGVDILLATQPEEKDGQFTGNYIGQPCFQHGKITVLNQWLEQHPFDLNEASFYSDSHNDLPLLRLVGKPYAVNPDATLLAEAQRQSWPVLNLRVP